MNPATRREFFARLAALDPDPKTELVYDSPFELLVAVLLSAQATDRSVNEASPALFEAAPTPKAMLALGEEGIARHIRRIGLYRTKAKHLAQACAILVERHGGEVPRDREALEALPGVGRKTANVMLNVAFGEPTIAVDTHIFRVSNRSGMARGKTPAAVERALLERVPREYLLNAHHWLILLGRYICKARKPECWRCPVATVCDYRPKTPEPQGR